MPFSSLRCSCLCGLGLSQLVELNLEPLFVVLICSFSSISCHWKCTFVSHCIDVPEFLCVYSLLFSLFPQSDVQLIKTGDKVGASEATLLNMLNISPFSFGLVIQQVFDNGSIYNPEVLDITEETLHKRFLEVSATTRTCYVPLLLPNCCGSQHCPRMKYHLWYFLWALAELGALPSALQKQSVREYLVWTFSSEAISESV